MSRPVQSPADRRTFLGSSLALASAVAASEVPAAAEPHTDAVLLALRAPFLATLEALDRASNLLSAQRATYLDRHHGRSPPDPKADRRHAAADRLWTRRCDANRAVVNQMTVLPARTLEGVALKALASHHENHLHRKLVVSLMADLIALGELTTA